MYRLVALASAALLASCSSSGVVPIGPDTYMISKPGDFFTFTGGSVAADLYREAGAYCAQEHKNLMPVHVSASDSGYAKVASAELQFRCLADGDPELKRPVMRDTPNVRLETQH
jgi:hypothetical protein